MNNRYEYKHYALFRVLLGSYLLVHFLYLVPYATEVFSSQGALPNAVDSPFINAFPNILGYIDTPLIISCFLFLGVASSIFLIIGKLDRAASMIMVYILACLLGRNPLINNPSLPFIGWMLLLHVFVPRLDISNPWRLPKHLFFAAWFMLSIAYSYSGYTKLLSPSWLSGDTIRYVYENPLARDYFFRDFMLWLPPISLKVLTWLILCIELLFAPLALIKKLRPALWSIMFAVQLGFLFSLNFPDLTFPMLLIHMLTFDPAWLRSWLTRNNNNNIVVLYDGECGLCHKAVTFIIARDSRDLFMFSPLQEYRNNYNNIKIDTKDLSTFYVLTNDNKVLTKSDGFCYILKSLGGLYKFIGITLKTIPKTIRDIIYDKNAKLRHKYFKNPDGLCPALPMHLREKFDKPL